MKANRLRARVYGLLHPLYSGSHAARIIELALMALIVLNIIALILESVPDINASYNRLFVIIEVVSVIIFTIEYLLRVWSSPENPEYSAVLGRTSFPLS